jgi:hypothetical protein
VRGLVINRFGSAGIQISGAGGNVVEGNRIGTDASDRRAQHALRTASRSATRRATASAGRPRERATCSGNLFGVFARRRRGRERDRRQPDRRHAAGSSALANAASGIWIFGASGTIVGGAIPTPAT